MIEFRVCWSASSNIGFRGFTDWEEYDGEAVDPDAIIEDVCGPSRGGVDDAMERALEASGFDCWVELRKDGEDWS